MDPYAPPAAPVQIPLPPLGSGEKQAWSVEDALSEGWRGLKTSWPVLIFGYLIAALPGLILSQTQSFVAGKPRFDDLHWWGIAIAFSFGGQLFECAFAGGLSKQWIDVARGRTPSFADLFGGMRFFPSFFLLMLIDTLVALVSLPLLLVPYVIFKVGTMFARFFIAEDGMAPIDALRASWRATQGERLRLFGFGLLSAFVAVSGLLLCCVGILATVPLACVALAWVHTRIARPSV